MPSTPTRHHAPRLLDQIAESRGRGTVLDERPTLGFSVFPERIEVGVASDFAIQQEAGGDICEALAEVSGLGQTLAAAALQNPNGVVSHRNVHCATHPDREADDVCARTRFQKSWRIIARKIPGLQAKAIGDSLDNLVGAIN